MGREFGAPLWVLTVIVVILSPVWCDAASRDVGDITYQQITATNPHYVYLDSSDRSNNNLVCRKLTCDAPTKAEVHIFIYNVTFIACRSTAAVTI